MTTKPTYTTDKERWEKYNPSELPKLKSALCTDWLPNKKLLRGYRADDLIRTLSFSESIFLSLFGRLPNEAESRMFDALLVAYNFGTYGSSAAVAAREIYSTSENSHAAIAGGLLAFGFLHGGANDAAAFTLQDGVHRMKAKGLSHEEMAKIIIEEHRSAGKRIAGIGHSFYMQDPRVVAMFEMAEKLGFVGDHVKLIGAIEAGMPKTHRTNLVINAEGAGMAIICDMLGDEYDYRASNVWHLVGRMCSVAGATLEEIQRGSRLDRRVPWEYDGPPERELPKEYQEKAKRRMPAKKSS